MATRQPMSLAGVWSIVSGAGLAGVLLVWLLGGLPWWASPLTEGQRRIEDKLAYSIWLQQHMCQRVFKDDPNTVAWLGCAQKP